MNYQELASTILKKVGGIENVIALEHCATRLRFNLKDDSLAKTQELQALNGVVSVINKGGQYQVVIGNDVIDVFKELMKLGDFNSNENYQEKSKGLVNTILDTISGIFFPIVPALAGAGMLKALLSLLSTFKLVTVESSTYQFMNFMGDACFYFLPIIIAGSAAKKFKVNQYVAMSLGAMLVHPTLISMVQLAKETGDSLSLFGLPVSLVTYTSSVIPIILAIWFMSKVEPFVTKVTLKPLRIFMVPLLTMLIVGLATLIVIGPLGNLAGQLLGDFINFINQYASWLVPLLVGAFTPLMVMTGMHYGLIPIGINMLVTTGFDTVAGPGMMVSNIAQGGAALAVAIRSKSTDIKALATSSGISAVCGITEPAMYGISLRFKKPLIAAMIGGGTAGLFIGVMDVGRYAQVAPGLFALPSFIGDNGFNNFIYACIGCVIAFVVSFIVSYILGIEEPEEVEKVETSKQIIINDEELTAPLEGTIIPLNQMNDPVFASEALGKGIAIVPDTNKVYAPSDGIITVFFETGHAIGLTTDNGAEVLIHVGIDTVELKGQYYHPKVKQGDVVKQGDLLLEFDLNAIKERGYDLTTPVIITNTQQYTDITAVKNKHVNTDDQLLILTI